MPPIQLYCIMNNQNTPPPIDLDLLLKVVRKSLQQNVKRHWLKASVLLAFAYIVYRKDLTIAVSLNGMQAGTTVALAESESTAVQEAEAMNISMLETEPAPAKKSSTKKQAHDDNAANTFSNMTYTNHQFATKESTTDYEAKVLKQKAYVTRFAKVAQTEMKKFGVPASIILAQGLLESDAGDSRLAVNNNNHFGVKCFSRTCRKGHCSNFTDDSHKDFFRIYENPWESYRAHSQLLRAQRYLDLYKLGKTDYKSWAYGLKRAGYATDKFYAEKLINLIEALELHQYDE